MEALAASLSFRPSPLRRSSFQHQQGMWSWPRTLMHYANETSLWYLEQRQPQLMCLRLGTVEFCMGAQASPDGANKGRNEKST